MYEIVSGETLSKVEFTSVRGEQAIKAADIALPGGKVVRTAVVHGLGHARELMEQIRSGTANFDFIEVMACQGGCITGGGQPIPSEDVSRAVNVRAERAKAIYTEDESLHVRQSHKNPYIQSLYREYLGEPNGHLAHELLHTHYTKRDRF